MVNSFFRIIFYLITIIFFLFSTNHIISYFGSHIDIVSNLDPVSIIFVLFSITILPHQ